MKTILLVGAAGSGKTWVMKQLIDTVGEKVSFGYGLKGTRWFLGKVGMFLFHRTEKIIVLGKYDGSTFEGSDKLSMAVMRDLPVFKEFAQKFKWVVCEGDRFMNKTFIEGMKPVIIKITNDGSAGRKLRGSNQTERQLKSLSTRVANVNADHLVKDSKEALALVLKLMKK